MTLVDQKVRTPDAALSQIVMQSGGKYDANCRPQASDVEAAASILAEAARSVSEVRHGLPVVIADYGCAEGKNSRRVTDILKENLQPCHPYLSLVRNDLARNDFSRLIDSAGRFEATAGRVREFEFVRPGSFFEPVMPPGSVDIACSFAALHWMSATPETDGTAAPFSGEASIELRSRTARLAEQDWRQFLRCRSEELSVGGRLVVSLVGRPASDDRIHGPIELLRCAADQLARENIVSEENLSRFVFPVYRRTVDEVLAPFRETHSELCRRLAVQKCTEELVACPLLSAIRRGTEPAIAARHYVRFIRAFSEGTIRSGLFADDSTDATNGKLKQLYGLMERLAVEEPERYQLRRTRILLLIQSTGSETATNPYPRGARIQSAEKRITRAGELSA